MCVKHLVEVYNWRRACVVSVYASTLLKDGDRRVVQFGYTHAQMYECECLVCKKRADFFQPHA
jgi:hypothetical protein